MIIFFSFQSKLVEACFKCEREFLLNACKYRQPKPVCSVHVTTCKMLHKSIIFNFDTKSFKYMHCILFFACMHVECTFICTYICV